MVRVDPALSGHIEIVSRHKSAEGYGHVSAPLKVLVSHVGLQHPVSRRSLEPPGLFLELGVRSSPQTGAMARLQRGTGGKLPKRRVCKSCGIK